MKVFWKKKGEDRFKEAKPKGQKRKKVKGFIAKGFSKICGGAHFTFESAAEITAYTEAKIVHDLTGEDEVAVLERRFHSTDLKQQFISHKIRSCFDNIKDILGSTDDAGEEFNESELNQVS